MEATARITPANDDPFAILEIDQAATVTDAERARKKLAPLYFPEKVKAAGSDRGSLKTQSDT